MEAIATPLIVLADLWAIVRTLRSDANTRQKILWVAIVLLLPFIGVVAWILFGPS